MLILTKRHKPANLSRNSVGALERLQKVSGLIRLFAVILFCTGCVFRDSPAVEGKWFGGRGDQLSVYLDQHYTYLNADGAIGRIGMLGPDGGYLLRVTGRGLIRPDSSLHFELFGLAGRPTL